MQMAIPLYLTTIEQDIFDTFRYLPHAVAVGVGFVTVAAAWKNRQMIKKQKRLEHAHAVPGTQLLLCFLVVVYFAMMFSITLFSREPGSRTGVDVKLFETWGNQWLPDRYFVENILLFLPFGCVLPIVWPQAENVLTLALSACMISIGIEMAQYITGRGYSQLDDIVTNTTGAVIGYLLFFIAAKIIRLSRKRKEYRGKT